MSENLQILQSRTVIDMITVANEFCIFTESISAKSQEDSINFYQKILPLLYLKGSLIPDIVVSDEFANERFVTEEHWENIYNATKGLFSTIDIFMTLSEDNELVRTSFSDHIADIYQDLKDFVQLFQKNRTAAQENAVFECKRLFENHWGIRITRLIGFLHDQRYKLGNEEDFN